MKRALEITGPDAEVVVAELLPEVADWNREHLQHVNGHLMDDPRVKIYLGDVYQAILDAAKGKRKKWDAILLDTDNGPTSLIQPQNKQMYDRRGFGMIFDSLALGARVALWAADEEPSFENAFVSTAFATQSATRLSHTSVPKNQLIESMWESNPADSSVAIYREPE